MSITYIPGRGNMFLIHFLHNTWSVVGCASHHIENLDISDQNSGVNCPPKNDLGPR